MKALAFRGVFALATASLLACGEEDRAPPSLASAELVDATGEAVAGAVVVYAAGAQIAATAGAPTLGTIKLIFSELLDGASLEMVVRDPDTQEVTELVGRNNRVRLAPADGSTVLSTLMYRPDELAIHVQIPATAVAQAGNIPAHSLVTYLPAATTTLANVMGDLVRDKAGNLMPTATDEEADTPVLDAEGRGVAASAAFTTAAIEVQGVELPLYGLPDDPGTPTVDESRPATLITFSTGIAPGSLPAHASLVPLGGGAAIAVTAAPAGYGAMVATWQSLTVEEQAAWVPPLLDPAVLEVTPESPPLSGGVTYLLRIEDGFTDTYGVGYAGGRRFYEFTTSL